MTTPLVYGPLVKNLSTHFVELIARITIYSPQSLTYSFDHGLKVNIDNQFEVNLPSYLANANFSHIKMSAQDSAQHELNNSEVYNNTEPTHLDTISAGLSLGLTSAESHSILCYTWSFHHFIVNGFLHNHQTDSAQDFKDAISTDPSGSYLTTAMGIILTTSVFIASGLNKIMPTPELNPTYRGDSHLTLQDAENFKHNIDTDGEYTFGIDAFLSTSDDLHVAEMFSLNVIFQFEDDYGKNISTVSCFPEENEFLIEPGKQLVLTGYEDTEEYLIFHAKIIAPLIEDNENHTDAELLEFIKIVDWAKANDIPTDFITPHMQLNMDMLNNPTLTTNDVFTSHVTEYSPAESPSASPAISTPEVADPLPLIHQDAMILI